VVQDRVEPRGPHRDMHGAQSPHQRHCEPDRTGDSPDPGLSGHRHVRGSQPRAHSNDDSRHPNDSGRPHGLRWRSMASGVVFHGLGQNQSRSGKSRRELHRPPMSRRPCPNHHIPDRIRMNTRTRGTGSTHFRVRSGAPLRNRQTGRLTSSGDSVFIQPRRLLPHGDTP